MSDRIARLQEAVRASEAELFVLMPGASLTWLTRHGFDAHERVFLLFVPGEGDPCVVLPALEGDNWQHAVPEVDALLPWEDTDGPEGAIADACRRFDGVEAVAIEPLGMRYMEYAKLAERLPEVRWVDGGPLMARLRGRKDDEEAANIRRAAGIAEAALEETLQLVRPGSTEREIAAQLTSRMLAKGGEGISFGPIVLGGPKSALPHGVPDERPVAAGEFLLIDFGTSFGGYHCDITRTFVVGEPPTDRMREVYEAVRAGNEAGCAACRPGATAHEVHMAAQGPLDKPEFEEFYTHRTGHGMGLDIHEPPSIMEGNHERLEPGVVFTVEPGLYLEGWGGVRIEDDIRITDDGAEILTSFDKQLRIVGREEPR